MALGYVRPARPEDAEEIARIQLATWRVAYRRILPRHVLDGLDVVWMAERWRTAVQAPPSPAHRVLVAIEQGEQGEQAHLVGFTASGPADAEVLAPNEPADTLPGNTVAVTDLLVEPRWGRRGHGSRLLAASVDLWREDGVEAALAWAFEGDEVTRNFLTTAGWALDGAGRALDVDDMLVPQQRLHVNLTGGDSSEDA